MTRGRKGVGVGAGSGSYLEAIFLSKLQQAGLTEGLIREHRFHPVRLWRLDFAWPSSKIAVEVQGGIWLGRRGGHTGGVGLERDCEKQNEAALLGWRLIQVTSAMIRDGRAMEFVARALERALGQT